MTDEERIARLRKQHSAGRANHLSKADRLDIADRIEELVKERDFILSNQTYSYLGKNLKRWLARDLEDAKDAAEAKLTECEARLGKAVEMLILCGDMFDEVAHPSDPLSVMIKTTLVELEGKE